MERYKKMPKRPLPEEAAPLPPPRTTGQLFHHVLEDIESNPMASTSTMTSRVGPHLQY